MALYFGKPHEFWLALNEALERYGATPDDVARLLHAEQTRRRTAAVKAIFDKAFSGRGLGSSISPDAAAQEVAVNRDAILEALR